MYLGHILQKWTKSLAVAASKYVKFAPAAMFSAAQNGHTDIVKALVDAHTASCFPISHTIKKKTLAMEPNTSLNG